PGWSQRYYDLDAMPGEPFYELPIDKAFSKPVRVHTIDLTDRYHVTRKVDCCDRQNVDEFYRGPCRALSGKHTAQWVVFSWDLGKLSLEIVPEPAEPAQYRIWYNTGIIPEPTPNANAPIPFEYFRYARIKTSMIVLRYCHWKGQDQEMRKAEIALLSPVLE